MIPSADPFPLGDAEVHLWHAGSDDLDIGRQANLRLLLSPDETDRLDRFLFLRDRADFLVAHALLRRVLSLYDGAEPRARQFTCGPFGKPELADHPPALRFNLSHARGLSVVAVTASADVGADAECTTRPLPQDLIRACLSPDEHRRLALLPDHLRPAAFFDLWTLKEAYAKARGLGLSIPFADISFSVEPQGRIRVAFPPGFDDDPENWTFFRTRPSPIHTAAVAVRVRPGRPVTLRDLPGSQLL